MNYSLYTIEDFLTDDSFVNYCLRKNPDDVLLWENVLKKQPELSGIIDQATAMYYLLSVKVNPIEREAELLKLKAIIAPAQQQTSRLSKRLAWFSAAAAILICIGIYSVINRKNYDVLVPEYTENIKNTIQTQYNERRSVTLPDGSIVLLNGLTTLKIDDNYNKNSRVLWLQGEAHFSVAKNKERPFIVISGKTATTALGTSFKINNYNRPGETKVMLTSGKVNVGTITDKMIINHVALLPGEQVNIADAGNKFIKSRFSLQEVEDWANCKLVFSMASLQEIRSVLKDTYGVEIVTKNQPKQPIAFTGQFSNERLTEVLDAIGFSNHFTYTIKEDKVTLDFER